MIYMSLIKSEGSLTGTAANQAAFSSIAALRDAKAQGQILEARAMLCDREHNLHVDMNIMKGIIPRNEGAIGIDDGSVRDIALISRVGKSVCFVIDDIKRNADGRLYALLSRKKAQLRAKEEYIDKLKTGDVIEVKVTHMENFGVFCDIGTGISALLPIEAISVSRIPHPSARFFVNQNIKCIVHARDSDGRIILTHKQLLGTWEENAALFRTGETVPGIVRSVESYGIFIELTPNLAGLAEYNPDVKEGSSCAVFIKNIIPEKHKIKLIIVDHFEEKLPPKPINYFYKEDFYDFGEEAGR